MLLRALESYLAAWAPLFYGPEMPAQNSSFNARLLDLAIVPAFLKPVLASTIQNGSYTIRRHFSFQYFILDIPFEGGCFGGFGQISIYERISIHGSPR